MSPRSRAVSPKDLPQPLRGLPMAALNALRAPTPATKGVLVLPTRQHKPSGGFGEEGGSDAALKISEVYSPSYLKGSQVIKKADVSVKR